MVISWRSCFAVFVTFPKSLTSWSRRGRRGRGAPWGRRNVVKCRAALKMFIFSFSPRHCPEIHLVLSMAEEKSGIRRMGNIQEVLKLCVYVCVCVCVWNDLREMLIPSLSLSLSLYVRACVCLCVKATRSSLIIWMSRVNFVFQNYQIKNSY